VEFLDHFSPSQKLPPPPPWSQLNSLERMYEGKEEKQKEKEAERENRRNYKLVRYIIYVLLFPIAF
jgi:hypothetical protein